jgi:hypothetical protein
MNFGKAHLKKKIVLKVKLPFPRQPFFILARISLLVLAKKVKLGQYVFGNFLLNKLMLFKLMEKESNA